MKLEEYYEIPAVLHLGTEKPRAYIEYGMGGIENGHDLNWRNWIRRSYGYADGSALQTLRGSKGCGSGR